MNRTINKIINSAIFIVILSMDLYVNIIDKYCLEVKNSVIIIDIARVYSNLNGKK